jgi:hypothetical protein
MKKIDVGQLVQMIANLGVIASIVFLAIQVQQNSAVQRAEARAIRAQIRIDGAFARAANPALLTAALKQRNGEQLSEMDELLLGIDARGVLFGWQYIYGEFREGLIESADVPIQDWRSVFARGPSYGRIWQEANVSFRPDFVAWMNQNVVPKQAAAGVPAAPAAGASPASLETAIPSP